MTCKNCIHYKVCLIWTDYWLDINKAIDCENFKNKAEFINIKETQKNNK